MNHDDFDRDPVTDDEFFGELADMMELVDKMTRERLSGGELERRRKDIMDRVRGRVAAGPAGDTSPAPAPRLALDTANHGRCMLDGDNRITVRLNEWRSPVRGQHHHGNLHPGNVLDSAVVRHLGSALAAAIADAERYRDGALHRAAEIVKQAQQEADALLAQARRTLDEAHRTAAAAGRPAHGADAPAQRDPVTLPPGRPSTGWQVRRPVKPATPARSGQAPMRICFIDIGAGKTEAILHSVDHAMWLRAAETVPSSPALYLITVPSSACDESRQVTWPTGPLDPHATPAWGATWLTSLAMTDAGGNLAGLTALRDAVLFECKSAARPSDVWRRRLGRLCSTGDPLAQFLRSAHHEVLAQALPDVSVFTTAPMAAIPCAGARSSHLISQYPARWSGAWAALLAAGADNRPGRLTSELLRWTGAPPHIGGLLPVLSPAQRLLLACDVDGFGRADASLQSRWRHAVHQVLGEAASQVGLDSSCWQRQRAGDGELAILPIGTSWRAVFEQLIGAVDRQLHDYNRYATDDARLRLRVAVHEGTVAGTSDGFAGQAAATVTRLVDAPPLQRVLDEHPKASMAVAVSDPVFHEVTAGRSPERDRYIRITVPQSKEPTEDAWMFVPDGTMRFPSWLGPSSDDCPTPRQRPPADPRQVTPA